jgi:hypothetical protein
MNRRQFDEAWQRDDLYAMLSAMNEETERLIRFAKNVNAYGSKIVPELIDISEDKKRINTGSAKK